jgi:hypothetical protein
MTSPASNRCLGIYAKLAKLGLGELRVIELITDRLIQGQAVYGLLDIAKDPRDFNREVLEEVCDSSVYAAVQLLKLVE